MSEKTGSEARSIQRHCPSQEKPCSSAGCPGTALLQERRETHCDSCAQNLKTILQVISVLTGCDGKELGSASHWAGISEPLRTPCFFYKCGFPCDQRDSLSISLELCSGFVMRKKHKTTPAKERQCLINRVSGFWMAILKKKKSTLKLILIVYFTWPKYCHSNI